MRITTKAPNATLPFMLATYFMPMVYPDSVSAAVPQGVGAGPFVLKGVERGTALDLEANPHYYKPGLPRLKGVRLVAYADENLRVAALRAGDLDLIEYVPWQSMAAIEADPNLVLQNTEGPFMFLEFNGRSGPLADKRVRQAIAHGIKRDEVVKAAFFGRGSPLEGLPLVRSSPFFDPALSKGQAYDPARAKQLLAEAGVPDGFSTSLLSTATYGMHKDTAEVIQQNLAALGIKVELRLPDWATRVAQGNRGQFDMAVQGTAAKATTRTASPTRSTAPSARPMAAAPTSRRRRCTSCWPRAGPSSTMPSARPPTTPCRSRRWTTPSSSASPGAPRATPSART